MADALIAMAAIVASLLFALILIGCTVAAYMWNRLQQHMFLECLTALRNLTELEQRHE